MYFWNLPRSQLAILLEQLSMRFSKEMGRALQDDLDLFARIEAADVLPEFTQESVGHPSGQLSTLFSRKMSRALQNDSDLLRVLGMYMARIGGMFLFSALFKWLVKRRYVQKAVEMIADSGGQKFVEAPFENIVYSRRDGHSNPGYCPTRWGDSAQLCQPPAPS